LHRIYHSTSDTPSFTYGERFTSLTHIRTHLIDQGYRPLVKYREGWSIFPLYWDYRKKLPNEELFLQWLVVYYSDLVEQAWTKEQYYAEKAEEPGDHSPGYKSREMDAYSKKCRYQQIVCQLQKITDIHLLRLWANEQVNLPQDAHQDNALHHQIKYDYQQFTDLLSDYIAWTYREAHSKEREHYV